MLLWPNLRVEEKHYAVFCCVNFIQSPIATWMLNEFCVFNSLLLFSTELVVFFFFILTQIYSIQSTKIDLTVGNVCASRSLVFNSMAKTKRAQAKDSCELQNLQKVSVFLLQKFQVSFFTVGIYSVALFLTTTTASSWQRKKKSRTDIHIDRQHTHTHTQIARGN